MSLHAHGDERQLFPVFPRSPRARRLRWARCGAGTLVTLLVSTSVTAGGEPPIRPHPENPHVFLWRGKPTVLATAGEHYGAVLNLDFDYKPYLRVLGDAGMNLTRIFSGAYVERPEDIQWMGTENTLAPGPGRLLPPGARSRAPGYAGGSNKVDLDRWDPAYFDRLKDFVAEAGRRGIVVEYVLFSQMYSESQWSVSPLRHSNNVQGVGREAPPKFTTLAEPAL